MKPGRKAHLDPPVEWKVSLPQSLAAQIEVLLADPLRGGIAFGARSKLIQTLLREWVDRQRKTQKEE